MKIGFSIQDLTVQFQSKHLLVCFNHTKQTKVPFKFEALKFIIDSNIDIFLISETKMGDSFPTAQSLINELSAPCRFDRNSTGDGLLLYIHEDIPYKILKIYHIRF